MSRTKAISIGLAIFFLLVGYLAYAFRVFYLTPELEYDNDIPQESREIIGAWYEDSKYRTPPSIESANYAVILMQPHTKRPTVPVRYDIAWEGQSIALEFYWKPWERAVLFSNTSGKWEYAGEVAYPE